MKKRINSAVLSAILAVGPTTTGSALAQVANSSDPTAAVKGSLDSGTLIAQASGNTSPPGAQPKALSASDLGTPLLTGAVYSNGTVWLFNGNQCLAYDLGSKTAKPGFPKSTKDVWGLSFEPTAVFQGPGPDEITFEYSAAGKGYYSVFPMVGQGPNGQPKSSGPAQAQFSGMVRSVHTAALSLPERVIFFNDDGYYEVANTKTQTANDEYKTPTGSYQLPRIDSRFPGIQRVDSAFFVPQLQRTYIFAGKYYWVFNPRTRTYDTQAAAIDSNSWPGLSFAGSSNNIAAAPVNMTDYQGVWQTQDGVSSIAIAQFSDGYKLRFINTLQQGIDSLKGSQSDREIARSQWPTTLMGSDPQALTSTDSSNGATKYKLLNPQTLQVQYPDNKGNYSTYLYVKKTGATQADSQGVTTFNKATMTVEGHPGLALPSGTIEFSFKPDASSGPLVGAQGRFFADYDQNGLNTANGRINAPIKIGDWNHIIISSDGFTTTVGVNGQQAGTLNGGIYMGKEGRIVFGARDNATFQGQMKNVRLWDAAIPLSVLFPLAGKTLYKTPDLHADMSAFLLAEDGKTLKDPSRWEQELQNKTVYIVAYQTVQYMSDGRSIDRRAAITLANGPQSAYVAADASGQQGQIFNIKPTSEPGYYTFESVGTGLPVSVADATQHFDYGTLNFVSHGVASNVNLVVDGRHLTEGTNSTRDPRYSQFRFVRQAVLNGNNSLELAWIIQPRTSAELVQATKTAFTSNGGSFQSSESLGNEVIQMDPANLGAAFKCEPYKSGTEKQRLFTLFPASANSARPAPIALKNFPTQIDELQKRHDSYQALSADQKDSRLYYLAPPTDDTTGILTQLLQGYNRFYATVASTNATPGALTNFEQDFLRPVPSGLPSDSGALDTGSLRGLAQTRFDQFKAAAKTKTDYPQATDQDFANLWATITDRLNARSALETLVTDLRGEDAKYLADDRDIRQELLTSLGSTAQADIQIVNKQDPEQFFSWQNQLSMFGGAFLGIGVPGASSIDQGSHHELEGSAGLGFASNMFSLVMGVASLEIQIGQFCYSQMQNDYTVSPYTDGSQELDNVNRILSQTFTAASYGRQKLFTTMASLCMYDPTLLEEIYSTQTAFQQDKATQYQKAQDDRKKALRKQIMASLLPACGAIVGVNRDTRLANGNGADQIASGGHRLDDLYNSPDNFAPPKSGNFAQLTKSSFVAATVDHTPSGTMEYFSWHLVKRPASCNFRNFTDALMNDIRQTFPTARELVDTMKDATYVQATETMPLNQPAATATPLTDGGGSGTSEGIWMRVPGGDISAAITEPGTDFTGKNTGHTDLDQLNLVREKSDLALYYWPQASKLFSNADYAVGQFLPPPVQTASSGSVFQNSHRKDPGGPVVDVGLSQQKLEEQRHQKAQ